MLLSLGLHVLCTAIIIFFSMFTNQHPETVRVLLTLEPPGGGGGGGGNSKVTVGVMKPQGVMVPQTPPLDRGRRNSNSHRPERSVSHTSTPYSEPSWDKAPQDLPAEAVAPEYGVAVDNTVVATTGAAGHSAGGEGTEIGVGKGSGTGPGTGSGRGTGIGSGSGSDIGRLSGPGHGSRESPEALKSRYLQAHFSYIRDLILKNLTYPPVARKLGWQGNVKVSFVIKEDGKVEQLRIAKSSGYEILDRKVVETIREVQPFPKPPVRAEIVIPVVYALK